MIVLTVAEASNFSWNTTLKGGAVNYKLKAKGVQIPNVLTTNGI